MTDDEIMSGFSSLHAALVAGFDAMNARFSEISVKFVDLETGVRGELARLETELRRDIAHLESRTMRRFDAVDARIEDFAARITRVEGRPDATEDPPARR